ncbi:MAG: hypothetical protein LBB66_04690 [Desulfovibrio sp.]|nr:hypothetical protein [Desulfovibrio sp.]
MRNADGHGGVTGQADAGAAVAVDAGARCGSPDDADACLIEFAGGAAARLNGEPGDLFHTGCACGSAANGREGDTRAPAPKDGVVAGRWLAKEDAGVAPDVGEPAIAGPGAPAAYASAEVF